MCNRLYRSATTGRAGARFCQDQCAFLLFSAVTEVPLQLYAAQKWLCLYLQK
jgi:hypothetical protein